MVDLSAINLLRGFHFDTKTAAAISMSDVVNVQYDLLQKTKNVVANVCDNIAKDVIQRSSFFSNLFSQFSIF